MALTEVAEVAVDGASGGGEVTPGPRFVEFSREESRGRREDPMFTLQASGLLSFNHAAFAALGDPVAVALLYDADQGVVALRKVEKTHQNAYVVRRQGRSQSYLVSAQGFTTYHEIPTVTARRFLARAYGDGIWGFALREGDAVKNRRGARDELAVTDRWRHTTNGFDVSEMMNIGHISLPPDRLARQERDRPPRLRIGTVVACASLGSSPPTSELRSRFLDLLSRPPIGDLVVGLTYVPGSGVWQRQAGRGRTYLEAVLAGDDESEAPAASASLLLPEAGMSGYGADPRFARLVVEVELRDSEGRPAPAMTLPDLHDRFARALAVPAALAGFLTGELGLATSDDPGSQVGILLQTPRAIAEVVDTEGLEPLPGSQQSNQFIGWAIADPGGESAAAVAVEMVRQMCDYALCLDGYEPVLEALGG
jgi:hypothetical protein